MTNIELADKIAGLPPVRIACNLLCFLIPIALLLSFRSTYKNEIGAFNTVKRDFKEMLLFYEAHLVILILAILIAFLLIFYTHKNSMKRRKVFLRNFKLEDLKSGPQCSIQRTGRLSGLFYKREKLSNWTGSIFRVLEQENTFVIFNESPLKVFERLFSKTKGFKTGVLLNYEGHNFFYCSSWIAKD